MGDIVLRFNALWWRALWGCNDQSHGISEMGIRANNIQGLGAYWAQLALDYVTDIMDVTQPQLWRTPSDLRKILLL